MKFLNVVLSNEAPNVRDAMWLKPVENGFTLYALYNGVWNPVKLVDDQGTADISDDKKKEILHVTDIKALTTKQCNALNVGDQIIKKTGNQQHLYTVTYKEEKQGLCLSYIDAENAETVAYDYNGTTKQWAWTDTTVTPLGS